MISDMIKKEGWTELDALCILRSKFKREKRHQQVAYVNRLLKAEERYDSDNLDTPFQRGY
jgi:hypothetical protein